MTPYEEYGKKTAECKVSAFIDYLAAVYCGFPDELKEFKKCKDKKNEWKATFEIEFTGNELNYLKSIGKYGGVLYKTSFEFLFYEIYDGFSHYCRKHNLGFEWKWDEFYLIKHDHSYGGVTVKRIIIVIFAQL